MTLSTSARARSQLRHVVAMTAMLSGVACTPDALVELPGGRSSSGWVAGRSASSETDPAVVAQDTGDGATPTGLVIDDEITVEPADDLRQNHAIVGVSEQGDWVTAWSALQRPDHPFVRIAGAGAGHPPMPSIGVASEVSSHPAVVRVGERWLVLWSDHTGRAIRSAVYQDGRLHLPRNVYTADASADDPLGYPNFADAVALDDHRAVIVWSTERHDDVMGLGSRTIDVTTGMLGPLQRLDASVSGPPSVTALPAGGAEVAWVRTAPGYRQVRTRSLDADGLPVGPGAAVASFDLRTDDCDAKRTAVAAWGSDRLVVAWQCDHGAFGEERSAHAVLLDGARQRLSTILAVGIDRCGQRPVLASAGRWFLLAWEGCEPATPDVHQIYLAAWSFVSGEPLFRPKALPGDPTIDRQRPDVDVVRRELGWEGRLTAESTPPDDNSEIRSFRVLLEDGGVKAP